MIPIRPLPDLYAEAADALDTALPALLAIVEAHPIPCSLIVAQVQSCICTMRNREGWLRGLASHRTPAEASS